MNELKDSISGLCESLWWSHIQVLNLDDDLNKCSFRSEGRRIKIEKLEVELERVRYMFLFSNVKIDLL